MRSARTLAQAKINLFLRVGPRDATGYHEIATLFQRIDLADELTIRVGGTVRAIDCIGPRLPSDGLGPPDKNLAYRAALAYAERAGWLHGFAIELVKHIPVGGGLGGGSADAGAVLRALDALAPRPVGSAVLHEIAASLGSDVPFMATAMARAHGSGRGEKLAAASDEPSRPVVLAIPRVSVSTADAYRWLDEDRARHPPGSAGQPAASGALSTEQSGNDFEPVVEARHPELRRYRERLRHAGARVARLSGSGATVFGIFDPPPPGVDAVGLDTPAVLTRTAERVVQVEVRE